MTFAGFRLDLARAELTRSGTVIPLRAKVFLLLKCFVAHAGTVLSKQALLAQVWPGVVVTDDSLSQCVVELRAALADEQQAIIRTVPRLGYRFDAAVHGEDADAPAPLQPAASELADATAVGAGVVHPAADAGGWRVSLRLVALLGMAAIGLSATTLVVSPSTPRGIDAALAAGRSVSVIPFVDLSEPKVPHFSQGVTQELITDLLTLRDATVVASPDAAPASVAAVDVKDVGRRLGVRHVLTGSVRRDGERVQIQVQMARTDTAAVEWAQRFDYANVAEWNWRADVSQRVAATLDAKLLDGAMHAARHDARSGEAIDEWMRGQYLLLRGTTHAHLLEARKHFELALAADPGSVNALADISCTYVNEVLFRWAPDRRQALAKAKDYALRAMAQDANHSHAVRALGNAHAFAGEFDQALPLLARSLQLTPNFPPAHREMGMFLLYTGRFAEAEAPLRTAVRLDPLGKDNLWKTHSLLGQALMAQGRSDEGIKEFRLAEAAEPTVLGTRYLIAAAEAHRGNVDFARRELTELLLIKPGMTLARLRANASSPHPAYLAGRRWMFDGLRMAGLPEGEHLASAAQPSTAPR